METEQVLEVAKGISDYGVMAIISAIYLVLSAIVLVTIFSWFKSIINQILESNKKNLTAILEETQKQNELLHDVSEGLRTETQLRLKSLSGFAFDLSLERTLNFIDQVREENNIQDREKTHDKIIHWLENQYEDRKTKFDLFTYRGRSISSYCNPEWVDLIARAVEDEVYSEKPSEKRARTSIKILYDNIRTDFYHRMNKE